MFCFNDPLELFSAVVRCPGRFVLQRRRDTRNNHRPENGWEDYRVLMDWWNVFNAAGDCRDSADFRVVDTRTHHVVFGRAIA